MSCAPRGLAPRKGLDLESMKMGHTGPPSGHAAGRRQASLGTPVPRTPTAVETACHATNRLYLHKLLGKTAYKLLTSNKHQVGYFRVFGSKCYILDKHHRSKFAPKSHEGFLLGYGSNSHTYRVYNNFTRKVEDTVDVKFDESNGSQVE